MKARSMSSAAEFQTYCEELRAQGHTLGLVPTMGALHEGHLALVREAAQHATRVVVTIFVNPTQFGPNEDFQRYPRDLAGDCQKCESAGASVIFTPNVEDMYLPGDATRVQVSGLTEHLCGPFRPGHFDGVATVVTKLLALTGRCVAVFGRKDYQQLKVIERLVQDLHLPVRVVGHPTVREVDGLALSSRNAYLSIEERVRALVIPTALSLAVAAHRAGQRLSGVLRERVVSVFAVVQLRVEYVSFAHPETLVPYADDAELPEVCVLAIAVYSGKTRLIDNVVLGLDAPPIVPGARG